MTSAVPTVDTDAATATGSAGLHGLLRRPLALAALILLLLTIVACTLAPLLTAFDPLAQDLSRVGELPSPVHPLGTDTLGRDIWSRLLFGGRPALLGVLAAVVVYFAFGLIFGLIAGYSGGVADKVISVCVDLLMSLPGLVVMFAVLALFNNNLTAAMVTLGFFSYGGLVRVVRAATKATREELYVSAARVFGISTPRILSRHIAPRLIGPVVIQVSLFAGIALVVQSGLGFINLGVVAPEPSWGGMIGEASQVLSQYPWLLVPSGAAIGLNVLAFGIIGDAVRDINAETKSRTRGVKLAKLQPASDASRPPTNDALVEVDGLTIAFGERLGLKEVVHGISFSVRPGELVGLVGESGSGKTISALALLGLLPSNARVTARTLGFDGHDLSRADQTAFRQIRGTGIGLVSQEPMVALDPGFTVGSQLAEVLRVHGASKKEATAGALELLRSVRLPDPLEVARRYPHELSGGMAQRVVIAMALAGEPKLLLADEPTTALDVTVQAEILDLLRTLRDERGMAILLVTHDLGVVADFCERAIVMQHGTVVESADVETMFSNAQHEYTRSLIAATPSLLSRDAPSTNRKEQTNVG